MVDDDLARGSSPIARIDDPLIGAVLDGKYRIDRLLGLGGMGAVYRARHVELDRDVAVKVLHQDLLASASMRRRFEVEARIAGELRHANLVGVIDMLELPGGSLAMVCEYARGRSLGDLLESAGRLAAPFAIEILRGICRGLEAAHGAGLVHRDLKPDNIVVEQLAEGGFRPRIIDFGIALARDQARQTEIGMVVGTPTYMAPEQALAHEITARTDLFALGVIAYQLLTGKTPFGVTGVEAALANLTQTPPPFAERVPGIQVDEVLEAIVMKLLARLPGDRFASANAVVEMLDVYEHDRDLARSLLGPAGGVALRPIPAVAARIAATKPATPDALALPRTRTRRRGRVVSEPIAKLARAPGDSEPGE